MINKKFGILDSNNNLSLAPNPIITSTYMWSNPPDSAYHEHGYYPIHYTEQPENQEGYYYTSEYRLVDDVIEQSWKRNEIVPPENNV